MFTCTEKCTSMTSFVEQGLVSTQKKIETAAAAAVGHQ